jgi:hypothetical protein
MGTLRKISKYRPSVFQGRLDFSAARTSLSITAEHPYEALAMRVLLLALFALAALYLYFVGASVLHIVARKEAVLETTRLQSAIASMEQEYFTLSHEVDESVAKRMGLVALEKTHYVYKPGTAVAATIPGNGI